MDEFLSGKLSDVPLWGGIALASIGSLFGAMTAEGVSGGMVAAGGVAVVAYGLWSASRDRATKRAFEREQLAYDRLDETIAELEACKLSKIQLQAKVKALEAMLSTKGINDAMA